MKILAIAGSNSLNSINNKLVTYTASLFNSNSIEIVKINEINVPIYSIDLETEKGIPEIISEFSKKIDNCDLILISLAEHNGSYNAAFKNIIDWTSRIKDRKTWGDKPMLLMSTSPGERGGVDVLTAAKSRFPYMGAILKGTFIFPQFYKNFDLEKNNILNSTLDNELKIIVDKIILE